jgi:hypothetical protein
MVHAWRDEDAFRAEPARAAAGHRGADAKFSGFITGSAYHSALRRLSTDNDGPAAQRWIVPLLDSGVKGIHVQVENDASHILENNTLNVSKWVPGLKSGVSFVGCAKVACRVLSG